MGNVGPNVVFEAIMQVAAIEPDLKESMALNGGNCETVCGYEIPVVGGNEINGSKACRGSGPNELRRSHQVGDKTPPRYSLRNRTHGMLLDVVGEQHSAS